MFYLLIQIYKQHDVLVAKLQILNRTNMIDYAVDIRQALYPNEPIPGVCIFF